VSRWNCLLGFMAAAADLVLLGSLVFSFGLSWLGIIAGIATISTVAALFPLAWRPATRASSPPSPPTPPSAPLIPPRPLSSPAPSQTLPSTPDADPRIPDLSRRTGPESQTLPSTPDADPLANKPWLNVVEDCVDLYDELERLQPSLDVAAQEVADHCCGRLLEILERSGVTILAENTTFDPKRHSAEPVRESPSEGAAIEATLSPGFAVGRRVFRRARVKLAASILPPPESSP